jgi:uncharacterized protein YhaN
MKIHRLDLRAIGPFTGKAIDLSGGDEGFHLVYGDNERGKTSALRALGDMFFGIPPNSPDDFVHRYEKMRVGAVIARRDGERLEFLRRKGKKDTLLATDDKTPIDESELRKFLGGCDRAQFEQMFGIDHRSLVEGGKAIVRGDGEVGEVLFAAGAGIADLRSIADGIRKRADELFKPSASKPAINLLLAQCKEASKRIRESQLPSSKWAEHKKCLETATTDLAVIDAQHQLATQQRNRLERIRGALPVVARWKQLGEQLAAHADAPRLSPGFAERRRDTVVQLDGSRKNVTIIEDEIARIERELEGLVLPESVLMRAAQITEQHEALGAYRKAERDKIARIAEAQQEQAVARYILKGLRPDLDISQAASLRLSIEQKAEIQKLARVQQALQQQAEDAADKIAACQERLAELAGATQKPSGGDSSPLAEAIAAARSEGPIEQQAGKLRADIEKTRKQVEIERSRLGHFSLDFEALEKLPLPDGEMLERFDRIFVDFDDALRRSKDEVARAESERAAIERQLLKLRPGELPTEADLADERKTRAQVWQLVLAHWQYHCSKDRPENQEMECIEQASLAENYERQVLRADHVVDLLRHESQRVVARDIKTAELSDAKLHCEEASLRLQKLQSDRSESEARWRECWLASGIDPWPPKEMKEWLQRYHSLMRLQESHRELQAELVDRESRIAAQSDLLMRQLTLVVGGQAMFAPGASLQELLIVSQVALKRLEEERNKQHQRAVEKEQFERELLAAERKAEQAQRDLAAWRTQWATAITPLGLEPMASSEHVTEFVLQCDELMKHLIAAEQLKARIEGIETDSRNFREDLERLLLAVDPDHDLKGIAHEEAIEELSAKLQQATADKRNIERLQTERRRQLEKRDAARAEIHKLQARLDEHCREAGCATPEELPAIEKRAADAADLRDKWTLCEAELHRLGGGATIAELVTEVDATSSDEIGPKLDRLKREIEELEATRNALHQKIGGEKKALDSMDTSAAAAMAAEDEQEILARLETEVAGYLRLRLASAVLEEGIERYRKKNEGPVLSRASSLFARLTAGSFDGLLVDHDKQQIVGLRGNDRIAPTAMSEGSCDQLYLALRLASLETWIECHEPWPLIVDDILVSFDDRRSAAAFEVLAEVSKKTQVIFFAHHRHLVEIAERTIPKHLLFVHEL